MRFEKPALINVLTGLCKRVSGTDTPQLATWKEEMWDDIVTQMSAYADEDLAQYADHLDEFDRKVRFWTDALLLLFSISYYHCCMQQKKHYMHSTKSLEDLTDITGTSKTVGENTIDCHTTTILCTHCVCEHHCHE